MDVKCDVITSKRYTLVLDESEFGELWEILNTGTWKVSSLQCTVDRFIASLPTPSPQEIPF